MKRPSLVILSVLLATLGFAPQLMGQMRGRPQLNAARTTFVADNGQRLRGPYESTEWTTAAPASEVAKIKDLGCNAVHLYAEVFDPNYPNPGSTAPGYAVTEVDKMVAITRTNGLYLVMTIGNGANNGNHNRAWATNFWNFYAARYANQTHVLFEIHNEPMAWGPSYLTGTTPPGTLDMEIAAYRAIRANAPNTPVLLFSYAVLSGNGGANAALTDVHAFNQTVFGNQNAVWTNEAVAFHGYGGWEGTITAVTALLNAGYPCFMTEFGWPDWGKSSGVSLETEVTSDLERLGVSWLTFQYIPPSGVSSPVTIPELFKDPVDASGLSWTPDYGTWPVARGIFGNSGQPRSTVANWVNNFLTGTVRIQAEDFDTGGEGVACHDGDSTNNGAQYRTSEVVDITTCNDTGGGFKVGWTTDGEWLEYTILVREPGMYDFRLRYATSNSGCAFEVISNVRDTTGPRTLAATGAETIWATASAQVYLEFGRQKLRLKIPTGGFDLNWFELAPASTGIVANGNYKFLNAANALAMQGVTSSNTVIATDYTGSTFQQWNVQHMGGGQYKITSVGNGWSWNASGDALGFASSWNTGNDRCFIILPAAGGYHRFIPVGSGLSLAPATAANPSAMDQQEYSGVASQRWGILAPSAPQFPANLTATATSATQASLAWNAVAGATSYNVKRSTVSGGPYAAIATGITTTNHADADLVAGFSYYYVVSAVVGATESLNSMEVVVLPPWRWQDIGETGIPGNTTYGNGVFTMAGSGADIWGTADAFRFAYVTATGNCTIIARVSGVQNTDAWAKAGVMIRSSLAANAPNAFIAVTPGNGVTWQYRTTAGGNSGNSAVGGLIAPYWVRLVRSGNTFTGYRSTNGVTWTQQGTTTITIGATVYVGLALTSHNNSSSCVGTFDNVSVPNWTTAPPPTAPAGLIAEAVSSTQINSQWNASSNAASYNLKRASTNGGPYTIIATGVAATNYSDNGVSAGTTYYYVVSAVNGAGESTNSEPASATTLPLGLGALAHRYSFSEAGGTTVTDSVGGAAWNGNLPNGGSFFGGQLTLSSNSQHYVSLPAGIVSTLNDFTIETWVRLNTTANWNRIFDFGNSTTVNMFLTPQNGGDGRLRYAITTSGGGAEQQINTGATLTAGVSYHIAVTLKGNTGILYVNGVAVGTNSAMTLRPSSLGSTANNYIGRSQYPDPYFNGVVDEFRIYSVALSPSEIAATHALGPAQALSTNAPAISLSATPTSLTLTWPLASAGFTVQSRTNLVLGDWVNVTSPAPQIGGGQWQLVLEAPANTGSTFYRLIK
jgi:hypothetical protein